MAHCTAVGRRSRRGFVLVTTAVCLIGLLAIVGLATDLGRVYAARNELQVFADEAAFAASFELDGTTDGLARARSVAASGPMTQAARNRWYFGTLTVPAPTVLFASAPSGQYQTNPASPAGYRFVRVQVSGSVNLYFLPLIPGIPGAQTLNASATAGQTPQSELGDGLAPFSPDAHSTTDPDYGFTQGQLYTLRWAPPGHRTKISGSCPGDIGYDPDGSGDRGYIDVGQGSGSAGLRDAIVNNTYSLTNPLEVGTVLDEVDGQKSVTDAMNERFHQDSDQSAPTFASYHGNGRRLFTVAVNDGGDPARVLGFALFFLQPTPCGTTNTSPCCGEYVGAAVLGSTHRGAGTPGLYEVKLVQ
jgi:Flp pilus assembly protein TadG